MTWTHDTPTEPGIYAYRGPFSEGIAVAELRIDAIGLAWAFFDADGLHPQEEVRVDRKLEWFSEPITAESLMDAEAGKMLRESIVKHTDVEGDIRVHVEEPPASPTHNPEALRDSRP